MTDQIEGKEFMFTGRISVTRHEAQEKVRQAGGLVGSSVCSTTDYLVAGESYGSKLAKALSLGTKVLTEQEFQDLFKEEITDEAPLSEEEVLSLYSKQEGTECILCGKSFLRWIGTKYDTCALCSFREAPYCSHCNDLLIFIPEHEEYWCSSCHLWWKIPKTHCSPDLEDYLKAIGIANIKKFSHKCKWIEVGQVEGGIYYTCMKCKMITYHTWNLVDIEREVFKQAPQRVIERRLQEQQKEENLLKEAEARRKNAENFLSVLPEKDLRRFEEEYKKRQTRKLKKRGVVN